jgi:hypothetical protein
LQDASYQLGFFSPGITNRFNTLSFPFLSRLISRQEKTIRGVKGCSMHFWLEDAIASQWFQRSHLLAGVGKTASLYVDCSTPASNAKTLPSSAVAWHLYHPEANRTMLPENDAILEKCIKEKHTFTTTGLNP